MVTTYPHLRVQRLRARGFKKPEGAIYVGRPGKWANPFKVVDERRIYVLVVAEDKTREWKPFCQGDTGKCIRLYRWVVTGKPDGEPYGIPVDHLEYMKYWFEHFEKLNVSELQGKQLMCWCKLTNPCHVDVLLELANTSKN